MIVLDASVVVELLTGGRRSEAIRRELARHDEPFIVPHLLDIEVASALRRLASGGRIDAHRAGQFLTALDSLPADRYPHLPLLPRIWELRRNFTAYDAAYIALAEVTGSALYTCDAKLRDGHEAPVVIFSGD